MSFLTALPSASAMPSRASIFSMRTARLCMLIGYLRRSGYPTACVAKPPGVGTFVGSAKGVGVGPRATSERSRHASQIESRQERASIRGAEGQGDVQGARRQDRQLAEGVEAWW